MNNITYKKPGFYSQIFVSPELLQSILDRSLPLIIGTAPMYIKNSVSFIVPQNRVYTFDRSIFNVISVSSFGSIPYGLNGYVFGILAENNFTQLESGNSISILYGDDKSNQVFTFTSNSNYGLSAFVDLVNGQVGNNPPIFENKVRALNINNKLFLYPTDNKKTIKIINAHQNFGFGNLIWPNSLYFSNLLVNSRVNVSLNFIRTQDEYKISYIFSENIGYEFYSTDFDYSIPKGINIAFKNNATGFLVAQIPLDIIYTENDIINGVRNILKESEKYNVDIVIPLVPLSEQLASIIDAHLVNCENNRKERIAILGVNEINSTFSINNINFSDLFKFSLVKKRIKIVYPGKCKMIDLNGNQRIIDGSFLALAFGFAMLNYDVATSMTFKNLNGITMFYPEEKTEEEKDIITNKGITYIESNYGIPVVRRSITVDTTNIANQEISIVRSIDLVTKDLRTTLERNFIGTKKLPTTKNDIMIVTSNILDKYVSLGIISKYTDISVIDDVSDPRVIHISVQVSPVFSLLWGVIRLTITL